MGENHKHEHHHDHSQVKESPLLLALLLTGAFFIVELVAGFLAGSLALISDAAHMLTDLVAIIIALIAIKIAKKPADRKRTFGYYRFEILAPAFNAIMLLCMSIYILYEAYERIMNKNNMVIQPWVMLNIALIGLIINLICLKILSTGKDSSLNMKGAYLEVLSDMISSVGVIFGAIIIKVTGWQWVDSAIAIAIACWIIPRSWNLFKDSINILLEGVPDNINIDEIQNAILEIPGVVGIHDLHIWALSTHKISLSVHVVHSLSDKGQHQILVQVREMLVYKFHISHSTIQCEIEPCEQAHDVHHFI